MNPDRHNAQAFKQKLIHGRSNCLGCESLLVHANHDRQYRVAFCANSIFSPFRLPFLPKGTTNEQLMKFTKPCDFFYEAIGGFYYCYDIDTTDGISKNTALETITKVARSHFDNGDNDLAVRLMHMKHFIENLGDHHVIPCKNIED